MSALLNNPWQGRLRPVAAAQVLAATEWTHWRDLAAIYGTDDTGYARRPWGNAGVQYGLLALQQGLLSPAGFIALNAGIGGWLPTGQQQAERIWRLPLQHRPLWLSLFSRHNISAPATSQSAMLATSPGTGAGYAWSVAPRTEADAVATERAYRYGQLFLGFSDIPILDVRHYLDPQLDMHHFRPSLVARARLVRRQGATHQQRIWVADPAFDPAPLALRVMADWLRLGQEPADAADRCFAATGTVIAAGPQVWADDGVCRRHYPPLSDSRRQAGGDALGLHLRCERIPVATAVARGDYAPVDMRPYLAELAQLFPDGVCDYQQPDPAMPAALRFR